MKQKIVWITGASTGIGAEAALQMAAKGWCIIATARSEDKLNALVEKAKGLEGEIHAYPADVTDFEAISNLVDTVEKDHGNIDITLLNAGAYYPDPLESFNNQDFKRQYDVNVFGVINCIEKVLKLCIKRHKGHMVIVASVAGFRGLPKSIAYGSSKAALINVAESLYVQCKPHNIKVQVVTPGFVRTPMTDANEFEMPMLMEVEDAAAALIKGMESDRFEITFPRLFSFLIKLVGLLPDKLYFAIVAKITRGKV